MAAYVGVDPRRDITWVTHPSDESMRLLGRGEIDAFIGFPPEPQELRAKRIGHVVVNSAVDRPWSQYFCCMAVANQEFARKYPVATKRALRAILKAADICALDPDRAAKSLEAQGVAKRYDYALQTMKDVPYTKWRNYDPEDTMRFYALRLNEIGDDQVEPAEDHRAGHGLAVPQRAEEGAEGMMRDRSVDARSCAACGAIGTAACSAARPGFAAAEPPPETTKLRLLSAAACWAAPQYVAEDLLTAEGFADVRYVRLPRSAPVAEYLAAGKADISLHFVAPAIISVDRGHPVVFLAGVHVGCFELIGTERVRRDPRSQGEDGRR